ncbi:WD40 repeat-like protein [Gymnopilus junonius]|uniref:WD40 repeat-like protein n=1 Tax=Gymnopilus junonius TaxID=109634 RepID=A0A9P5TTY4_GYMJU|nr:WD40 repeat-like protein [Gymnopilus junonius]
MRPRHTLHPLPSFPVYSCAFLSPNEVVLGGGGGASRSGIKNKLRLYNIDADRSLELKDEFELERGEDAPMSMAGQKDSRTIVCGVNSVEEKLLKGENVNCRAFSDYTAQGHEYVTTRDTDDFQKVTALSPDGTLLAVAGSHDLTLLSFPSLQPVSERVHSEKEIYDASFSSKNLVITTTQHLLVYALPTVPSPPPSQMSLGKKSKKKSKTSGNAEAEKVVFLELQKTIELPSSIGEGVTFRTGRFHPSNEQTLYTIINIVPPRSRKSKSSTRQAYICKWNTETWKVERTKKVADSGLTCMDLSSDGRFLGYGSSNLTIGMLDAKTLSPLVSILKAHEFPPTVIKFNPITSLLISGSADNSIRIVSVPSVVEGSSFGFIVFLLLTVLILLLAIAYRQYQGSLGF